MATRQLKSNLKLISTGTAPTTTTLPRGFCAFGTVSGVTSLWGNITGSAIVNLIAAGTSPVTIVQVTGNSTTSVMSQDAVTRELGLKQSLSEKDQPNGYAGLDAAGKIKTAALPDYLLSKMLFGGTINQAGLATLSAAFKAKYNVSTTTLQMTSTNYAAYEGVFFIAQDTAVFTNVNIIGVANVSTGDWIMSIGTAWQKVDNTDAVVSVRAGASGAVQTGEVVILLTDLRADSLGALTAAATRANIVTNDSLLTAIQKLMKWYADFGGLAWKTQITPSTDVASGTFPSANIPVATATARGGVSVQAASVISLTGTEGAIDLKIGDGLKKNASNQLEADIELVIEEI